MFRLAKDLGKTVYEIETQMSMKEFKEWLAYYNFLEKKRKENKPNG